MTDPAIDEFQHACKEADLLGKHPPQVHCRLCEEVPLRTIMAALPLLTDRQVHCALEEVEHEVQERDLRVREEWADLPARLKYALEARGKSVRWLWDRLRMIPGLPRSYATVHSYANGRTTPTPQWAHEAAQVLKIEFNWLSQGAGKPPEFGVSVD